MRAHAQQSLQLHARQRVRECEGVKQAERGREGMGRDAEGQRELAAAAV